MHQGDLDNVKGVYHINAVDTVTQYQFVGSAERIAEWFLLPVLEGLLESFPFRVRGFHSDNGSEYRELPGGGAVGEAAHRRVHQVAAAAQQ